MGLLITAVQADAIAVTLDLKLSTLLIEIAALDADAFAIDKGFGNLPSGRLDDPSEGLARNTHL